MVVDQQGAEAGEQVGQDVQRLQLHGHVGRLVGQTRTASARDTESEVTGLTAEVSQETPSPRSDRRHRVRGTFVRVRYKSELSPVR